LKIARQGRIILKTIRDLNPILCTNRTKEFRSVHLMKGPRNRPIVPALGLAVLYIHWGAAYAQKVEDNVVLESGSSFDKVTVTLESYENVTFILGGTNRQSLPYDRIKRIEHGDEPTYYRRGIAKMAAGEYDEAIDSFNKARQDKKVRAWIHPYSMFRIAQTLALAEKHEAAIAAFEALLKEHPNNVFLPQAHEEIGNCYLRMGDEHSEKAITAYRKLIRFGDTGALKSYQGEARVLEGRGDFAAAERKYREVIAKVGNSRDSRFIEVINTCYKGVGRCLLAADKGASAAKEYGSFRRYCLQTGNKAGLAIVHNGLGDCERKAGNFEAAILQYLRVNILYGEVPEEDARAIFYAATCYENLVRTSDLPKEERYKKQEWSTRSIELFREVKNKYPSTVYGKQARKKVPTD